MITIMKKYENPMLQVVGIKSNDIITMSPNDRQSTSGVNLGAGRFRDDNWDAGY